MRKLPLLLSLLSCAAGADTQGPYQPLAFLAGHCWKGDLPGQDKLKQTDEHCFSWVYDGRFLRDRHVVHAEGGRPDYLGETTYYWDAAAKQIEYIYIENQGGFSRGDVQVVGNALVFPATDYVEGSKTQTYRSRWQRAGDDAYDVVTEFKIQDGWRTAWSVHMQKGAAP
jgi:hypothetical protein